MKIENQVCTFEQGFKLEQLGITAEPQNYWVFDGGMKWKVTPTGYFYKEEEGIEYCPAFSVAELGVMLPHKIKATYPRKDNENVFEIALYNDSHGFTIQYENKGLHEAYAAYCRTNGSLEAYTRAAMLIHLLESGHINSEQVNQNLLNS